MPTTTLYSCFNCGALSVNPCASHFSSVSFGGELPIVFVRPIFSVLESFFLWHLCWLLSRRYGLHPEMALPASTLHIFKGGKQVQDQHRRVSQQHRVDELNRIASGVDA